VVPVDVGAIDLEAGEVWRDGRRRPLTALQRGLLQALIDTAGPITTETLLRDVWGYHPRVRSRAVASTVVGVRRLIERDPRQPRHLLTVRGEGYRFVAAGHAPAWVSLSASAEHPGLATHVRERLALYAAEALSLEAPAVAVERLEALRHRPSVADRALCLLIGIRPWLGDLPGAAAVADDARARGAGCEHSRALLALRLGDRDGARRRFVALAGRAREPRLHTLCELHGAVSEPDRSDVAARLDAAVASATESGDLRIASWTIGFRGELRADRGDLDGAGADADAAERFARRSLAEHELAAAWARRRRLARRTGDAELAAQVWSELKGLRQRPGFATAHPGLVRGLRLEGQREVAQRTLRRGRALARKTGDVWALGRLAAVVDDP